MNRSALLRAVFFGTLLQLAMVITGHYVPFVKDGLFMWLGMALSAFAGLLYAWRARGSLTDSLVGGAIAGGVSALIGILVSYVLGDVPALVIAVGTFASTATGLVGGGVGRVLNTAKT